MTGLPAKLASLHAEAFDVPRPWSAAEFAAMLADPGCVLVGDETGFALFRRVADEAELLTMAVPRAARRQGRGRTLLGEGLSRLRASGVSVCHLEVAAGNTAARALYAAAGFAESGRRRAYYRGENGQTDDAILMAIDLGAIGPPAP